MDYIELETGFAVKLSCTDGAVAIAASPQASRIVDPYHDVAKPHWQIEPAPAQAHALTASTASCMYSLRARAVVSKSINTALLMVNRMVQVEQQPSLLRKLTPFPQAQVSDSWWLCW